MLSVYRSGSGFLDHMRRALSLTFLFPSPKMPRIGSAESHEMEIVAPWKGCILIVDRKLLVIAYD